MKKPTAKKVVANVAKPKIAKTASDTKEYQVTLNFNGQDYTFGANNLEAKILEIQPQFLKTRVVITVDRNGTKIQRFLLGVRARQFFRNRLFARLFLKNLLK